MPLDPTPAPGTPPQAASLTSSDAPAGDQPATVPISQDQLQQFMAAQTRLAQLETEARQREEAASAEAARLLAAKGQVEEALKTIQSQSEAKLRAEAEARMRTEERAKRYALDNELSKALAGHPLLPGTSDQLTAILRSQLQVEAQGDSYVVRTPTFVPALDFVSQTLARPEFAHFLRPHGAGGAGAGGAATTPTPVANPTPAPEPKNFSEAIILQMKAMQQQKQEQPAALDPRQGFGLKAIRHA